MQQLTEQLKSLVITCEGETRNLKTDMVKLGVVQTAVAQLMERIDEIQHTRLG